MDLAQNSYFYDYYEKSGKTNVFCINLFPQLFFLGNVLISVILANILWDWQRGVIVVVDCSYEPVFKFNEDLLVCQEQYFVKQILYTSLVIQYFIYFRHRRAQELLNKVSLIGFAKEALVRPKMKLSVLSPGFLLFTYITWEVGKFT